MPASQPNFYNEHELSRIDTNLIVPKLTINYACIADVVQVEPKEGDNQRKNRKVKPDASGLKLRYSLKRVGQELKRVREGRYGENED